MALTFYTARGVIMDDIVHSSNGKNITVSVVIPVFNEAGIINELYSRLITVLDNYTYQVIFVDDGSSDNTFDILRDRSVENKNITILKLSRNFGHQQAILKALQYSAGTVTIVMDGDLQDPPELIPQFIKKWKEGYDVVYAIRQRRKESLFLRLAYFFYYRLLGYLSDLQIPMDSGDFSLMSNKVVEIICSSKERNLFIRGLRAFAGFKQTGLIYDRYRRTEGKAKYNLKKLTHLGLDGIFSFSNKPLYYLTYLGITISGLSLVMGLFFVFLKIFYDVPLQGWTSLIVTIFFSSGLIIFSQGIIALYLGRIFEQVKKRPLFIIDKKINLK